MKRVLFFWGFMLLMLAIGHSQSSAVVIGFDTLVTLDTTYVEDGFRFSVSSATFLSLTTANPPPGMVATGGSVTIATSALLGMLTHLL